LELKKEIVGADLFDFRESQDAFRRVRIGPRPILISIAVAVAIRILKSVGGIVRVKPMNYFP